MPKIEGIINTAEIIAAVASVAGSYSPATFRRDLKRFNIQPLTPFRTAPRLYPHNTVERILVGRGYQTALAPLDTATAALANIAKALPQSPRYKPVTLKDSKLVTAAELRKARPAASKGKAKR